jgi:hypothetical protein
MLQLSLLHIHQNISTVKRCADVANGAVDLACLVLGENIPTSFGQTQAAATVIVNTLLISTNICEPTCDIGAEIDALIDAKMNP